VTGNDAEKAGGVIVVVDYHSHLPPAVEVAIALANRRRLALRGLLVEDPDLASVCLLPFSQEVILTSARPRALEEQRLRRSLQAFDRRFRALLSQGAERAALDYSFSSVHGRSQALALSSSDYFVLGQPGPIREPSRRTLRVMLVGEDVQAALAALDSLRSIGGGKQLELLLVNGATETGEDSHLRRFLADHPEVSCQRLQVGQLAEVFRRVNPPLDLVVTSRQCGPELLERLLKLATCPVILSA
jgi:hypothetical protein